MPYHSIISNDESSVVTTAWNPIVGRDSNYVPPSDYIKVKNPRRYATRRVIVYVADTAVLCILPVDQSQQIHCVSTANSRTR